MIIKVARKKLPKNGDTSIVFIGEKEICIINQNEQFFAVDNLCPHKGASLGIGKICNDEILCPLHEYRFNFKTGACNIQAYGTQTYELEIID
jgi:nitrite reductase/ring-hydroxylating ferredoxin subunit